MASPGRVAVSLPLASLYLNHVPLPARRLIEAGVPVAVATDFNPGSAPSYHLPLALSLACTLQRMTPAEALKGATIVAARALGLMRVIGSLEPGKSADFAVIDADSVNQWLLPLHAQRLCRRVVARGRDGGLSPFIFPSTTARISFSFCSRASAARSTPSFRQDRLEPTAWSVRRGWFAR